jgi:hypothetical protein
MVSPTAGRPISGCTMTAWILPTCSCELPARAGSTPHHVGMIPLGDALHEVVFSLDTLATSVKTVARGR